MKLDLFPEKIIENFGQSFLSSRKVKIVIISITRIIIINCLWCEQSSVSTTFHSGTCNIITVYCIDRLRNGSCERSLRLERLFPPLPTVQNTLIFFSNGFF